MAGYPPSYPPPPGPPFGFDARQHARFVRQQMKDQARAQKAAIRAQRDLYRYQARANRRSSILTPLLVVTAGIVLLLVRMGRIPAASFWAWYTHWWPLLLVGAGVVLVAEWAFDEIAAHDGPPRVRRTFGGGAILLLLLVAATGAVAHLVTVHGINLSGLNLDGENFAEIFGEKHETTQQIDAAFPAGSALIIDNPHGDVTIAGKSDDDQVHITVSKQIYSQSDSDADARFRELNPHLSSSARAGVSTGQTLNLQVPSLSNGSTDLTITLPDFAEATINANHGDVSVSGLHAPVTINANHGDVTLNGLAGAVTAHVNNHSSSLTAHQITGDLTVRGNADDMNVTDVTGQVSLEGEFFGDTHLERLHGPTSFRTTRTQFSVGRVDGTIDISPHADLSGRELVGPTSLRTRSRNISFEQIAGDVDVTNSDGSVDIVGSQPLGNVTVDNKKGEVNVTVPDKSAFSVNAQTSGGSIENDFNLPTQSHNNVETLEGSVGTGGPRINIHTTHLDIGLHQRTVPPPPPPAEPAAPSRPRNPAAPAKPTAPAGPRV